MWQLAIAFIVGLAAGWVAHYLLGTRNVSRSSPPSLVGVATWSDSVAVDALAHLSETHRSLHAGRSDRDFTVVTTTLAFYGAAVAVKYGAPSNPYSGNIGFLLAFAFVLLALFVTFWIVNSDKACDKNQAAAEWAEDALANWLTATAIAGFPIQRGATSLPAVSKSHPNRTRWLWLISVVWVGTLLAAYLITS